MSVKGSPEDSCPTKLLKKEEGFFVGGWFTALRHCAILGIPMLGAMLCYVFLLLFPFLCQSKER
jgi:hypothetical protein